MSCFRSVYSVIPFLIIVILISCGAVNAQEEKVQKKINVAVLDLEISGGIPEIYQKTLSDRLRLELLNTGRFIVIERNAMEEILSEQGLQMSGCTSDECAVEVGRLLGVEGIIAGSIGKVGNTHSIILRHINVETGAIVNSKGVDCSCPIDEVLSTRIGETARLLAGLEGSKTKTSVSGEGDLLVKSSPFGATVFLDEEKIKGTTPFAIEKIAKGEHFLRLELGDLVASTIVNILPGQINRVEVTLEKAGEIYVTSNIETVSLIINGKKRDTSFPATLQKLTPGTYSIEITKPGFTTFKQTILLKPEQKVTIKGILNKQQGTLSFARLPKGTVVTFDGEKLGTAPLLDKLVDVGWHIVNINRKKYAGSVDKDIEIKAEETFMVDYDLELIQVVASAPSALPKSLLWPGLGQIGIGRKTPGLLYVVGETGAVGFLVFSILNFNGAVSDYDDALLDYDAKSAAYELAKSNYDNAGTGDDFAALFDAKRVASEEQIAANELITSSHEDAESTESMIFIAGGIAGGIYLLNILDAIIFEGEKEDAADHGDSGIKDIKLAMLGDSRGRPSVGISLGITFGSTGRKVR
ncbi:MAG: PEGA domain-containing protein [Candidatus Electryonea clarkiae]|nr:PEGA domain-containing protein [Candidatus Electryonea clarkiae]MDP8286461.1 PEGA domain-containing protein [Candidatus Electryonea clarkiae]